MHTRTKMLAEPFGADRQLAEVLREVNELRRSRSLTEYHPATTTLGMALRRRSWSRRVRSLARLG